MELAMRTLLISLMKMQNHGSKVFLHKALNFAPQQRLHGGGGLVAKLCPTLATPCTVARQAPLSMGFSRQEYNCVKFKNKIKLKKKKNTGVDSHFLLQGIFPTQESSQGLLHCRQILYRLSYEGSPETTQEHTNGLCNNVQKLCSYTLY